jgi:hypothetical protein
MRTAFLRRPRSAREPRQAKRKPRNGMPLRRRRRSPIWRRPTEGQGRAIPCSPAPLCSLCSTHFYTPIDRPPSLDPSRIFTRRPGSIAYAGSAHIVLPPMADSALVNPMTAALVPAVIPRQADDGLADEVRVADRMFAERARRGSIVIFTDAASSATPALKTSAPVSPIVMLPAERAAADPTLTATASALDARLVTLTPDASDIDAPPKALAHEGAPSPVSGEAPRWSEAGYWLTPLLDRALPVSARMGARVRARSFHFGAALGAPRRRALRR